MLKKSYISGVGSYLPPKIITNDDLSKTVDTTDEWIVKRTGIKQRHVVDGQNTADLAIEASIKALVHAGLTTDNIDGIVVATASSDKSFPATATYVAKGLGINKGPAYDISAACAGFVFAINSADNMIKLSQATNVLVIGVDVFSNILDWQDRNTCVLFGDGAGAVIMSASDDKEGVLSTHIFSDGSFADDLVTKSSPSTPDNSERGISMDGKTVYKFAVKAMSESVITAVEHNGLELSDLDWIVPHQANLRIIESVTSNLKADPSKVIVSLQNHANISAATIPLAMQSAIDNNSFKKGDIIALTAMGAGFSWGSCLIKWQI